MSSRTSIGLAAALSVAGAFAASAATVQATFDFAANFSNQTSHVFLSDAPGVSVTVTGSTYTLAGNAFTAGSAIDVEANAWGLISQNGNEHHTVDSWGADEAMVFDFGRTVKVIDIVLGWTYGAGWYDLFVDGVLAGNTRDGAVTPSAAGSVFAIGTRSIEQLAQCRSKRQGSYACTQTVESGIKILSMTVEYEDEVSPPPPPVAPVPLPAAGWAMLAALGGLAGLRRLRRAV